MTASPLVTVVTPSYNSGTFIEQTVQSVLAQTYPHIEYIIMDGGSTDDTLDILARYQGQLTVVSEPDEGQSDAINKGWRRARGDIIAWLCADDLYLPTTVETAVEVLVSQPDTMWVYGRAHGIDRSGKPHPIRAPAQPWDYAALLHDMNYITQPTVFLRHGLLADKGYLLPDLHFAMDYEYWLRIGQAYPPVFIDAFLAEVRYYPETKSASGGIQRLAEYQAIMRRYGAEELVRGYRFYWTQTYFTALLQDIKRKDWAAFGEHYRSLWRYPAYLPRTLARAVFDNALPENIQRQLRVLLIRER